MLSLGGLSVASAMFDRPLSPQPVPRRSDELQIAKEAAEAASHARRDFVASVSHDLRTPVNIIFGMADMALDVAVTAEQRELRRDDQARGRAAACVDQRPARLLEDGRRQVVDLAPRRFALRPWLEPDARAARARAAAKGVQLAAAVDAALPEAVVGDPDRLRQVVGNLVGNARQVHRRAAACAVRLALRARTRRRDRAAARSATPASASRRTEIARLFEPFAQARPAPARTVAPGSAWRSASAWSSRWAARSASRARPAAAAPSGSPSRSAVGGSRSCRKGLVRGRRGQRGRRARSASSGIQMRKVEPTPASLSTSMRPPSRSSRRETM